MSRIVGDTEDVWTQIFKSMGTRYEPPKVVLFTRSTGSSCGVVSGAAGPIYCPTDQKVYLDTAFLSEFAGRSGSIGDFAQAYLLVHEISHHVQNALGTMRQFESALSAISVVAEQQRNHLQVRLELQADCYTGVWVYFVQKRSLLEPGDLEEVPAAQSLANSPTHGAAAQRLWWFKHGLTTGDPRQCDTFKVLQP